MDVASLKHLDHKERNLLGICTLFIFSFFFSKFLLSISTGLFFLVSFWQREKLFAQWQNPKLRACLLSLIGIFFLTVFSFINSENTAGWLHFVKLKLPFLLFGIAFLNFPRWSDDLKKMIYQIFIWMALIAAVYVLINYANNFTEITNSIGSGKTIPTPIDHGKFSVLVSFAIFLILIDFGNNAVNQVHQKKLPLIIGTFLFLFLHILSVRSGLVILYAGIGVLSVYFLISLKRYALLCFTMMGMVSLPFIAYHTVPSFKNKVGYTMYDLKMQREGNAQNYSDGERISSLKLGFSIFKEEPILGTGIGDIRDLMTSAYAQNYPNSTKVILPHNQYILYATGYGLVGLLMFLVMVYYPLRFKANRNDTVYILFVLSSTLLFIVEKPLEETVYISFFCFISCLCFSQNLIKEK